MSKTSDRLTLLNTFVRIAEGGSISSAARYLGISQPSASRHLVELESQLQTQLMIRNTHSLILTDSGKELLSDARSLLESWESLHEKHINSQTKVKGTIKVIAPVALGQIHLAKIATDFQLTHPEVKLTWELDDSQIKFTESGCDCWIKVGNIEDETLIVKPTASAVRKLVASPELLKKNKSLNIQQVSTLPMITLQPFEGGRVPLTKGKNTRSLAFNSAMETNNIFSAKEACLRGLGVSVMPLWFITSELKTGELVDVLPDWFAPELDINIAYLPNKFKPMRLNLFIDHITARIRTLPGLA